MDHREPRAATPHVNAKGWVTMGEALRSVGCAVYDIATVEALDGQVVALEAELADLQASNHLNRQTACAMAFDHGRLMEQHERTEKALWFAYDCMLKDGMSTECLTTLFYAGGIVPMLKAVGQIPGGPDDGAER